MIGKAKRMAFRSELDRGYICVECIYNVVEFISFFKLCYICWPGVGLNILLIIIRIKELYLYPFTRISERNKKMSNNYYK